MSKRYFKVERKLVGIYIFDLALTVRTGLLIRRPSKAQLSIGGADVWPMTIEKVYRCGSNEFKVEVPYVPGSSLKGRMRSLTELSLRVPLVTSDGKIFLHARSIQAFKESFDKAAEEFYNDVVKRCPVDELFGYASFQYQQLIKDKKLGFDPRRAQEIIEISAITRLFVEDLFPSTQYVCGLYNSLQRPPYLHDFLEEKSENRVDRLTSAADPRDMVRVKPGVEFSGSISLLVFDIDRDSCPGSSASNNNCLHRNLELLAGALELVERLGLGAATTRGYGRVAITITNISYYKPFAGLRTISSVNPPIRLVDLNRHIEQIASVALTDK